MSLGHTRMQRVFVGLAVALLAIVVFLPAIRGGWIYDDHALIDENPYLRSFSWFGRWFTHDFWDVNAEVVRFGERMIYWRPLVTVSYAADWHVAHGSPTMFHVTNLLAHGAVAALVFVVIRRWAGSTWPAALASLLYALHPTKAENVAWIAGRTDVLCMAFMLVATIGIARRLRGDRLGIPLEVAGTVAAYMCKEHAIVLPALAAIEAWAAAGRPPIDKHIVKRAMIVALPQAATAGAYLVARSVLLPLRAAEAGAAPSFGDHVQAVLESFGRFFTLTFAPHDLSSQQALVHLRGGEPIHSVPYVLVGALGLIVLVSAAVALRKRAPMISIGIGFYLLALLPTSNLQYTEMRTLISDRFLYIPSFGMALAAAGGLALLGERWLQRGSALALACVIALGSLAVARSADFSDERSFWSREARLHPDSLEAHLFALRTAVADRKFNTARRSLGDLKAIQDGYDRIGWVDVFVAYQAAKITSRLVPDQDESTLRAIDTFIGDLLEHRKPSSTLAAGGVSMTIPMSAAHFPESVLKLAPQLLMLRADLRARLGDDEQAIAFAEQARGVCRTCVSTVVGAALTYARAGRYEDAFRVLDEASGVTMQKAVAGMRKQLEKARSAAVAAAAASGPAQLQARASELAALELWGRAYAVLAPHKEPIKHAPNFAVGFAELAFRAGDTGVAREVLASIGHGDIDAQLAEWALEMGWTE